MEAHSYLKWSNHARCLISNLGDTLEREEFVDVTLATSDGLFLKAHRLILCAASPYFQVRMTCFPSKLLYSNVPLFCMIGTFE